MGLLRDGKLVSDVKPFEHKVRQLAIAQFVNILSQNVDRRDPVRYFGDEIEYMLINVDSKERTVKLLPRAPYILELAKDTPNPFVLYPEYASYMVEGIPRSPYLLDSDYLPGLHESLRVRKRGIKALLDAIGCHNGLVSTLSSFPLLGCPDSVYKGKEGEPETGSILRSGSKVSQSIYTDDELISSHIRFAELAKNIRERRGKIEILVKAYQHPEGDSGKTFPFCPAEEASPTPPSFHSSSHLLEDEWKATDLDDYIRDQVVASDPAAWYPGPLPDVEPSINDPNTIHMDAVVFGMGMCCIQLTFSCVDIDEARYLHDQIAVLSPLLMALTASTVVFRGRLAATDTRWDVISQAVDDLKDWERPIVQKSRYSSTSLYIGNGEFHKKNYARLNDNRVVCLSSVYNALVDKGVDAILARHVAHILFYQPQIVYDEDLDLVDCSTTGVHFDGFQSTNWNSVRFKPPPIVRATSTPRNDVHNGQGLHSDDHNDHSLCPSIYPIPWRVELRCCEIQLRDSENEAFLTALPYFIKVLLRERWNLYIPLSLVDANIERASRINACLTQKFFTRSTLVFGDAGMGMMNDGSMDQDGMNGGDESNIQSILEMTLLDIFFGKINLIGRCLKHLDEDFGSGLLTKESYEYIKRSFDFIKGRCTGEIPTNATEIRKFIMEHPKYKQDGFVNQEIVFDLVSMLKD